jgi:hypothetical protein
MADLPITSDEGATPIVINDPTTTANVANVKAASTASVAADNSLVVALSPNSPVPTGTNKIGVTGVAQGSTTSGEYGDLIQGAVTTAAPSYTTGQTSPLSLTTVGNLRVDGSSVTQPISGTVTANAGTNLNTSALALDTSVNGILVSQGSTTSGEKGPLIQGAVTTANPSYTTAQTSPLSLDTSGNLRVTVTGSGGGSTTVVGNKTNNNAAPGATNLGVLPALANAASPSWTEGDQVVESVDLTGRQRIRGTLANNNAAPDTDGILNLSAIANAANPSYTEGNLVLLSTDLSGNLRVALQPTTKSTYAATSGTLTPGTTPTDIVTLTGSATKTIRVLKFDISSSQTTLGVNTWFLIKRSTANTGGTSTTSTAVPFDSNDAAATATFRNYTVNPTSLGTAVGTIATLKLVSDPTVGGTPSQVVYTYDFTDNGTAQGIVLRGTTQVFALNFNGAALPAGLVINVNIVWTEE